MTTQALAPTNPGEALAAILSDADRMRDIDVEKMERLFALSREFAKDVAKREFYEAFNTLQSRMEPVRKRGWNNHTSTHYAFAEDVEKMLDPLLIELGFSRSMSTEDCPHADHIRCVLMLRHIGGHTEQHRLDAPIDGVGAKGGKVMTRLQGTGSTMRYVERYLLCNVCGVQIVADDDGNKGANVGPGAERITEDQALDLEAKMEEHGVGPQGRAKLLTWLGVEKLSDLPASKLKAAMDAIERRRS